MDIADRRRQYLTRWAALETERSSWIEHWRELSEYFMPRTGRFLLTNRNRGGKRHNRIYDSTGTRALRVLAAGMMSGMSSPARPWFRLRTRDDELMGSQAVKLWVQQVSALMRSVFNHSNTYRALHSIYTEEALYGTAASFVMPDFDHVLWHHVMTAGQYAISTDGHNEVSTVYREFDMTVSQIVSEFVAQSDGSMDWSRVSTLIKNRYDRGVGLDSWVPVLHIVEPRTDRDPGMYDSLNMPYASMYLERDTTENVVLRESGYKRFPGVCPRWEATGGDIYGNGPGMEALGDVKQLMHEQRRKAQGIDYQVKPPLQAPSSLKNQQVASLPGGVSFVDPASPSGGIKTAWDVNIELSALLEDIQDVRGRIGGAFYTDLFLMLAQADGGKQPPTAREIAEKHEEKLLMLGPVMERQHNELLAPIINTAFDRLLSAGALPPPPPELHGQHVDVEFISTLAQAQRAVATSAMDRFTMALGEVAQFKPDVLDKFDEDQWADAYADALGVDPEIITPNQRVAIIRKARAQQQAEQAQLAKAQQLTQAAANAAKADKNGVGLPDITDQFSGYTLPERTA